MATLALAMTCAHAQGDARKRETPGRGNIIQFQEVRDAHIVYHQASAAAAREEASTKAPRAASPSTPAAADAPARRAIPRRLAAASDPPARRP
jgi:hypothetical protein